MLRHFAGRRFGRVSYRKISVHAVLMVALLLAGGCSTAPLRLSRTISLPGVGGTHDTASIEGRFDHFGYDSVTHRLFIAAVANGSLEIVGLDEGRRLKSISGLNHPQGVAVAANTSQVIVACGEEGAIRAYDVRTLEEKGKVEVGEDTDNVRFVNGYIFVGYGSETAGAIATVDPLSLKKISEMPLKAHPESFQLTPDGQRVYVNIPWAKRADVDGSIVAGDLKSGSVKSTWTLAQTARNFPMALDVEHHRLFVVSRKPAKLMCLDTETGNVLGQIACVDDSDDIYRDPVTGRIIVIGGGKIEGSDTVGAIDLFSVGNDGKLEHLYTMPTAEHARTGYFASDRRAVYIAVPQRDHHDAELREYLLSK